MSTTTASASLQITAVAFTGYPVTDMPRARAFYEGVLGLKTTLAYEHEGRSWVEYDIGPHTLAISNMAAENWKPSSDGPSVAFEVADFDAAIAALRAAGATFALEPMNSGVCQLAVVLDPDGNSVTVHHKAPAHG